MGREEGTREGGNEDTRQLTLVGYVPAPSYISRPKGQVAQLVEQRTENPRVGGSIPSLAIALSFAIPIIPLESLYHCSASGLALDHQDSRALATC